MSHRFEHGGQNIPGKIVRSYPFFKGQSILLQRCSSMMVPCIMARLILNKPVTEEENQVGFQKLP